jgi:hypothetical protein
MKNHRFAGILVQLRCDPREIESLPAWRDIGCCIIFASGIPSHAWIAGAETSHQPHSSNHAMDDPERL